MKSNLRCAGVMAVLALAACESERRDFHASPPPAVSLDTQASHLRAGPPGSRAPSPTPLERPGDPITQLDAVRRQATPSPANTKPFQDNRWAASEGKRLYGWFNCAGCHAPGGGGAIGPPLSDREWRYGSAPEEVFASIVEGRPNGMPSFRDRLPPSEIWKLVVHVRTLASLTPRDLWSARGDEMAEVQREAPRSRSDGPESAVYPDAQPEFAR